MKYLKTLSPAIILCLIYTGSFAQTYSGFKVVSAPDNMTLAITVDPTADTVQIKMTGPDSVWYSYGFGSATMSNVYSYIITGSGEIDEQKLGNHSAGNTLTSSLKDSVYTKAGGIATATVKRTLAGFNIDYYSFTGADTTILIVWGYGVTSALSYPHPGRGATTIKLTEDCIPTDSMISAIVCDSLISPSGNYTWDTSGTYFDTLLSAGGCDSILTVNLTILNSTSSVIAPTTCESYLSPSGNNTWTSSGIYYDTIPNNVGCDSLITINLTVNYNSSSTIDPVECDSYTSPSGNYTWTSSNTYFDTIPNNSGCDSFITVNLTINSSTSSTITPIDCDSYTSPSGNHIWTTSGTYMDTINNNAGCDSIITVNLTVDTSSHATISPVACDVYTSPSGNHSWTMSGTYMDTIPNAVGCDSVITVNLTINTVDTSVTKSGSTVTANATTATYQWLDCNNGYSVIVGETAQSFTANANGDYAVEVTQNACVDTSSCYTLIKVGIDEREFTSSLTLYPNPTSDGISISFEDLYTEIIINVRNVTGQLISTSRFESTSSVKFKIEGSSGVYFIEVLTNEGKATLRVFKDK